MPAPRTIALIPARMGSQRLKQKNLRLLRGEPLIVHAIRKCGAAGCFDEVWVNSEHDEFGRIAEAEGVRFHQRPAELASDAATSEQFVHEFLTNHPCERVFQVHSIAPLLPARRVAEFVAAMEAEDCDVLLSCVLEQIECACAGRPVNFTFDAKTNSQDLAPVQRVTWSITGWRAATFLAAAEAGRTATYAGRVAFFPVDRVEGHVIKTERDLRIADALWDSAHEAGP
jgi:CMP-N-acetylneuraminic acid synthetase